MSVERQRLERIVAAAEARLILAQGDTAARGAARDARIARRTGRLNLARQELAAHVAANPRSQGHITTPRTRRDLDGPPEPGDPTP